eukprot:5898078-Amphidinium_carterae.1
MAASGMTPGIDAHRPIYPELQHARPVPFIDRDLMRLELSEQTAQNQKLLEEWLAVLPTHARAALRVQDVCWVVRAGSLLGTTSNQTEFVLQPRLRECERVNKKLPKISPSLSFASTFEQRARTV